jgi:poly [ADP-ribose] polymerase
MPLHPQAALLVQRIFQECKAWTRKRLDISFEESSVVTPLGPLHEEQLRQASDLLRQLEEMVPATTFVAQVRGTVVRHHAKKPEINPEMKLALAGMSSRYFTLIPHKLGAKAPPVLDTQAAVRREQYMLSCLADLDRLLRRDGQVLRTLSVRRQYDSLGTVIDKVNPQTAEFKRMRRQAPGLLRLFRVRREEERRRFRGGANVRQLFHGSRMHNWLGILSQGMLLPAQVEELGVALTDSGWLGRGLYFGDIKTGILYAGKGAGETAYVLACQVALGRQKPMHKITYDITGPPPGYDSCHGVARTSDVEVMSDFQQDEYVVYDDNRQYMTHLLEIEGKAGTYASNA